MPEGCTHNVANDEDGDSYGSDVDWKEEERWMAEEKGKEEESISDVGE